MAFSMPKSLQRPAQEARAVFRQGRVQQKVQAKAPARMVSTSASAESIQAAEDAEMSYFSQRAALVNEHFPGSMSADDFLARVEVALCSHGFRGDNSIACTNLCRDEATGIFKSKIDKLFGSSFNTNGLGGVLTCGCVGMGAGLSHSPICSGKERYVFFSFPHCSVEADGGVGAMYRPGRPGKSSACGAMIGALGQLQQTGLQEQLKAPGVHDPLDPEFSILKHRLARRIQYEKLDPMNMDLVDITKVGERMITNDLEYLISKSVNTEKADYAVVTGIQVHNWGNPENGDPTLEFVMPSKCYVVNNGKMTSIDISKVPALTPRQMAILAKAGDTPTVAGAFLKGSTVIECEQKDPAAKRNNLAQKYIGMSKAEGQIGHSVPSWASSFSGATVAADPDGCNMEVSEKVPEEANA